jgi:drug/metabolite transporter (DMT)-like permease
MVALLAWPILRERLAFESGLGLVISSVGVSLTLAGSVAGELQGALFMVGSTALASLYVVCNQRFAVEAPALVRAAIQQLVGVVAIALLARVVGQTQEIVSLGFDSLALIGLTGIVQYGLAFWLYLIAVDKLPVTVATLFLALIPLFTVVEGGLFLGEQLTYLQWTGAVLVVAALVISVSSSHRASELM